MPPKHKYKKTDYTCPKCGYDFLYNINLDVFVCHRTLVGVNNEVKGSCGKFYKNGVRFK